MLPCVVIPLLLLWALSQALPPRLRFELTSPRLACVFVLLVILGWYEVIMPRLLLWRARRSALLRDRRRIQAQEAAKWRKEATRRCRNCLTAYRDQAPAGGRFMCTYCGHVSRRPVLDIPGIASGLVSSGIPSSAVLLKGGIAQIGIPVQSLYGGKNLKSWNGKGWPVGTGWSGGKSKMGDSPWAKEWPGGDSWLRGSWPGGPNYLGGNNNMFGDVFGGGEKCSACESYPRVVIFFLRIVGFFIFCIRWFWKKIFRRGSLGGEQSLSSGSKGCLRKGEEGYNGQGTKGEKARRKAEERRQARLEKEMREEEERKQREEVARLVEEQRRIRDEKSKAERESEQELTAQREKEIRREREADRKRQDKVHEKNKRVPKDKPQADGEEVRKKEQENGKKEEIARKGESRIREGAKTAPFLATIKKGGKNFRVFSTDTGIKSNEQGMKGGINSVFKAGSSRYLVPVKGTFQSPPKTSAWQSNNTMSLPSKSFLMNLKLGTQPTKPVNSGDVALFSDSSNSVGCTTCTGNMDSAWNKTDWTKSRGKGGNIITESVSRQELGNANGKGDKDSSTVEAQNPSGNCVSHSPGIKQLHPRVGFQLQPSSPMAENTNSLDSHLTCPSASCLVVTPPYVRSSLEHDTQFEVGKKSINEAPVSLSSSHFANVLLTSAATTSMPDSSVPEYISQPMNLDNSVPSHVNISPDKSVPAEGNPIEEFLSPRNPVSLKMPVSESLNSSSLNLKTKVISDAQTIRVSSPMGAPVRTPIQRPAPIELPISKLLPSDIVDEVHITGDQFPPITEPWGLRSLSLDCPHDAFKQFKWQMWETPQLGQNSLPNLVGLSRLPVGNGVFKQGNDFLPPCSEGTLMSPFEPESHLPSSLFSPQQKSSNRIQSSSNPIGGASISTSNSLWLNQPAFESAEEIWNIPNHHQVTPSFSNGGMKGEVEDSVITTDCRPYEQNKSNFWPKSGKDAMDKSKWSAEAASENSCWLTTIKASERPHIAGIYPPPHVQSVWSYKSAITGVYVTDDLFPE
ncbi:hypothetical protein SUGI_0020880 [Cryptomeria japonica]|nr:hypothetical protein SUGI_0020880 [Cryptomeria japonica]